MKFSFTSKSFGTKKILDPVTLNLEKGTVTTIMGASGSGKTTLLRLIAGLELDDSGTNLPKRKIGMVFQEPRLLPWKTVQENVDLAGPDHGLLESLGLESAQDLFPNQISLGMARRVAFARAIAFQPDILLLDEPFASLDEKLVNVMKDTIKALQKKGHVSILLVTHNKEDPVIFDNCNLTLIGNPAQLYPTAST